MSDPLRDRITRVLNRELLAQLPDALSDGGDLTPSPSGTINLQHLAEVVIAELGISRQFLVDGIISDDEPRPWEIPCETRWTTEWERFDGTA